jgi:hypothetical protein
VHRQRRSAPQGKIDTKVSAENGQRTYDDVMLYWAISELLSPTWAEFWSGPVCEGLRTKLKNEGIDSLSLYEQTWLIILEYGPFQRKALDN